MKILCLKFNRFNINWLLIYGYLIVILLITINIQLYLFLTIKSNLYVYEYSYNNNLDNYCINYYDYRNKSGHCLLSSFLDLFNFNKTEITYSNYDIKLNLYFKTKFPSSKSLDNVCFMSLREEILYKLTMYNTSKVKIYSEYNKSLLEWKERLDEIEKLVQEFRTVN